MLNNLSREQQLIILGLILLIVVGLGVMAYRRMAGGGPEDIIVPQTEPLMPVQKSVMHEPEIVVHVSGAVKQEGVFSLKSSSRLIDVLQAAGGATNLADLDSINLAEKVKDGQKIIVPVKKIALVRRSGDQETRISGTSSTGGKVNINTADEKELCKIPGIGKTTAQKIIDHRSSNGRFSKIEDIMKVKSIGKSKFGKIKNEITI